ncbi:MAG: hypothetical protein ABI905_16635, partial [Betaproteobacteria bacterium]
MEFVKQSRREVSGNDRSKTALRFFAPHTYARTCGRSETSFSSFADDVRRAGPGMLCHRPRG